MRAVVHADVTEYNVKALLRARKFIHREMANNWDSYGQVPRVEVIYNIRRKDLPAEELGLRFSARLAQPGGPGLPKPMPGVALQWHSQRIRGIDWKLRHDVVKNEMKVGIIREWHEHRWTDMDADRFVVNANRIVKQPDFWALVRLCLKRWNIEDSTRQLRLLGE